MEADQRSTNLVLLGTGGQFTSVVLQSLIGAAHPPTTYLNWGRMTAAVAGRLAGIELETPVTSDPVVQLCESHRIDLVENAQEDLANIISGLQADFMCCACWPALIGSEVIETVSCAAMNLHPSLLPAYRGIDPIPAQLQANETDYGVSLHLLNSRFDQGDLIAQVRLALDVAANYDSIETLAAEKGAGLLIQAISNYGTANWAPRPQA